MILAFAMFSLPTALSFLWLALLLCSLGFLMAATCGLLLRSRKSWLAALVFVTADLIMGVAVALLDRGGFAH